MLHLTWRLNPTGGIAGVIRSLAAGLEGSPVEVSVATVRPLLDEDGLDDLPGVHDLRGLGYRGRYASARIAGPVLRFAALARRLRPHVVHAHSGTAVLAVPAALAVRRAGRLLDVHDAPGNGRHSRATEAAEGWLCRRLGFVPVAHSTSVRREVAAAWRLPEAEVPVIPLCVPPELFTAVVDRATWRQSLGIAPGELVVLSVARLVPTKNIGLLIDAAQLLRQRGTNATFVVAAGGPDGPALQERIDRLGLTDRFLLLGTRTGAALADVYGSADVFCSTSDYEGFGLAVAEAMASGLPVVATAVGGVTDLVVDQATGVLVPAGDAGAVADALEALLGDPGRRRDLGEAGRARAAERFDRRRMAGDYLARYHEVAGAGRRPRRQRTVVVLKAGPFGAPGTGPLPYRIDALARSGLTLEWTDRHLAPARRALPAPVRRLRARTGPLRQTVHLLPRLSRSSAILAVFESEGHPLAALRTLPGPWRRPPLAVVVCWLAQLLQTAARQGRSTTRYRLAYRHVDLLLYFSRNQTAIFERDLGMDPTRLCPVLFGIDADAFPASQAEGSYVLAVGRDRGRDWATFFEAAGRAGFPTRVVCRPGDVAGLAVPANVEVLGTVGAEEYRRLLAGARVSVVATHQWAYPTGQSVFLESLATARATVVTSTAAMADYIEDGRTCLPVPAGDSGALAGAIARLYDDAGLRAQLGAAGRQAVDDRFNAVAMWDAIGAAVRRLTG